MQVFYLSASAAKLGGIALLQKQFCRFKVFQSIRFDMQENSMTTDLL